MSGSYILAPALAGSLYPLIGLKDILIIDLATCIIAITTLSIVQIPQPSQSKATTQSIRDVMQELTFGFQTSEKLSLKMRSPIRSEKP